VQPQNRCGTGSNCDEENQCAKPGKSFHESVSLTLAWTKPSGFQVKPCKRKR
jgi:hypothetical protein